MTSGKTVNTNKTLVANMQHVKWKAIPPLKGPDSQGLNNESKQWGRYIIFIRSEGSLT